MAKIYTFIKNISLPGVIHKAINGLILLPSPSQNIKIFG